MSWSISFIGKASKVTEAIEKNSETLTGVSKAEYDAVKDSFKAIVAANFNHSAGATNPDPMVQITANGHGQTVDGVLEESNCSCEVKRMYTILIE